MTRDEYQKMREKAVAARLKEAEDKLARENLSPITLERTKNLRDIMTKTQESWKDGFWTASENRTYELIYKDKK